MLAGNVRTTALVVVFSAVLCGTYRAYEVARTSSITLAISATEAMENPEVAQIFDEVADLLSHPLGEGFIHAFQRRSRGTTAAN